MLAAVMASDINWDPGELSDAFGVVVKND